ncbi:FAD-dependent oxidoreductase [Chloroflexota bacterium]
MKNIVFSSWAGKTVDNRGQTPDKYASLENLELPMEYDGHKVKAFMSWNGFVVADSNVNVVDMARTYLTEAQKLSCGECSVGYLGLQVMVEMLDRILDVKGLENDVDMLGRIGNSIKENSKCDFCASAVTPILDTLSHYKEAYNRLTSEKKVVGKFTYMARVTAPCIEACPAHQDIPGYIELLRNRRYEEALKVIRETNCMPGTTGRACVAFCESNCCRADIDSPIAIRALKRVPADYEIASGSNPTYKKVKGREQKVAVIGAGPAGLAASYNLALKGYKVTIYDEQPSGGGMALVGIPSYRLPREVLNREVDTIKGLGIEIKPNTKIGRDLTLDALFKEGYEAVFLATGAQVGREMGIEVEAEGLVDGTQYLHNVSMGKMTETKDKVLIVGGGNVAIDCARTCLRLGFKGVNIVYRRSRAEMPARKEEVEAAEEEGVKIHFLANPVKIITKAGKVIGVECIRMELGDPDASGRRRPIPISGSEFVIETVMLIPSVGEKPDLTFLAEGKSIKITGQETIEIAPSTGQTSQPAVFSGGDCVTGPATVVEAIAAGNRAARSIDQYLRTSKIVESEEDMVASLVKDVNLLDRRETRVVAKEMRQSPDELSIEDRRLNFNEVESCFTTEVASKEVERCLRCYRVMLLAIT